MRFPFSRARSKFTPGINIWNAILILPEVLSTLIKLTVPLKLLLYVLIGTSPFVLSIGILKRVPATTYSEFSVIKGEEWLPPLLGISIISAVRKVLRSTLAIRGVLLPFAKTQRPSCMPSFQTRHVVKIIPRNKSMRSIEH